ncbi:MAG: peptide-methionine (S)-S-oxide reductase, partial [Sulfuriferula sp.]
MIAINNSAISTITLGGGCFWCLEAVFEKMHGVVSVVSGYMGGTGANPTYQAVCTGQTGHAEVVQVAYDTTQIDLADILLVFFTIHDPT